MSAPEVGARVCQSGRRVRRLRLRLERTVRTCARSVDHAVAASAVVVAVRSALRLRRVRAELAVRARGRIGDAGVRRVAARRASASSVAVDRRQRERLERTRVAAAALIAARRGAGDWRACSGTRRHLWLLLNVLL